MQINKSSCPNSVRTKILKLAKGTLLGPLSELINKSFLSGIFPNVFRIAKVVKLKSRILCSNYRPISLLSNIEAIIEKLMHKRLNVFLEKKKIYCNFQFWFRSNLSTNNALLSIVESIQSHLDKNKFCALESFLIWKKHLSQLTSHFVTKTWTLWYQRDCKWMVFILSEEQSTIYWQCLFNHWGIANSCSPRPRVSARFSSLFTLHKWPSQQCQVCQNLSFCR